LAADFVIGPFPVHGQPPAFLWMPETGMRPIADLGAFFTVATKINDTDK
jgi:hypothetical protein